MHNNTISNLFARQFTPTEFYYINLAYGVNVVPDIGNSAYEAVPLA